jgi:hypothetical protein
MCRWLPLCAANPQLTASLLHALPGTCPGCPPPPACSYLQSNRLQGQLPGSWGAVDAWLNLRFLYLSVNPVGGTAGTVPPGCTAWPEVLPV